MVAAAKTIQINRGDMMAAELRESCSKIHGATKMRILLLNPFATAAQRNDVISVCCVAVHASTKSWTCVRGPETGSLSMFAHAFSAFVSPETSNESALIPLPPEKP